MTTTTDSLIAEVDAFLTSEPSMPHFESLDDRVAYLAEYQARLHAAGLAVPAWPVEYGGRGLGVREGAVVAAALGDRGAPELINYTGTDVVGPALLAFAEPERLVRWLPPIASAEELWCQLFSEPDAGSDLAGLRCRAERCADGWRINGQKVWSTWAMYSRLGLLIARTGSVESRHRGISAFVIDMATPGIGIHPLRTMTGSAEFAEVFFDNAVLPEDALIGEVDGGWAVATAILNAERGIYAVRRAAVIAAGLARLLAAGKAGGFDERARNAVVRGYVDLRLLRLRLDRQVEHLATGGDIGPEAALTKQLMTAAEQSVAAAGADVLGGGAMAWDDVESAAAVEEWLYSRAASIHGGTAQIQRNIIAERVLGLPREPVAPTIAGR